jgi:hypothetical protein
MVLLGDGNILFKPQIVFIAVQSNSQNHIIISQSLLISKICTAAVADLGFEIRVCRINTIQSIKPTIL